MSIIFLPKGSIMEWSNNIYPNSDSYHSITEHSREPVAVTTERIETSHRTANGYMRKYFIADKLSWSTSWNEVPHSSSYTVDGKEGADWMDSFYHSVYGAFSLKIQSTTYKVVFKDFSRTIVKRGIYNGYDVSVSIEEV